RPRLAFVDAAEYRAAIGAEINSRRVALVAGHRLTENGEEAALLRQAVPHRLPALAAVARSPDRRGGVGRKAAGRIAVQRQRPDGVRIARMNADGKAEGRRQAFGAIVPAAAAVARAPDAVVVLLVENVASAWRADLVVNAVPDFAIARPGRVLAGAARLGVGEAIAALPCCPAVLAGKHPGGRDADPEFFPVLRIGDDGVQRQPDAAGS